MSKINTTRKISSSQYDKLHKIASMRPHSTSSSSLSTKSKTGGSERSTNEERIDVAKSGDASSNPTSEERKSSKSIGSRLESLAKLRRLSIPVAKSPESIARSVETQKVRISRTRDQGLTRPQSRKVQTPKHDCVMETTAPEKVTITPPQGDPSLFETFGSIPAANCKTICGESVLKPSSQIADELKPISNEKNRGNEDADDIRDMDHKSCSGINNHKGDTFVGPEMKQIVSELREKTGISSHDNDHQACTVGYDSGMGDLCKRREKRIAQDSTVKEPNHNIKLVDPVRAPEHYERNTIHEIEHCTNPCLYIDRLDRSIRESRTAAVGTSNADFIVHCEDKSSLGYGNALSLSEKNAQVVLKMDVNDGNEGNTCGDEHEDGNGDTDKTFEKDPSSRASYVESSSCPTKSDQGNRGNTNQLDLQKNSHVDSDNLDEFLRDAEASIEEGLNEFLRALNNSSYNDTDQYEVYACSKSGKTQPLLKSDLANNRMRCSSESRERKDNGRTNNFKMLGNNLKTPDLGEVHQGKLTSYPWRSGQCTKDIASKYELSKDMCFNTSNFSDSFTENELSDEAGLTAILGALEATKCNGIEVEDGENEICFADEREGSGLHQDLTKQQAHAERSNHDYDEFRLNLSADPSRLENLKIASPKLHQFEPLDSTPQENEMTKSAEKVTSPVMNNNKKKLGLRRGNSFSSLKIAPRLEREVTKVETSSIVLRLEYSVLKLESKVADLTDQLNTKNARVEELLTIIENYPLHGYNHRVNAETEEKADCATGLFSDATHVCMKAVEQMKYALSSTSPNNCLATPDHFIRTIAVQAKDVETQLSKHIKYSEKTQRSLESNVLMDLKIDLVAAKDDELDSTKAELASAKGILACVQYRYISLCEELVSKEKEIKMWEELRGKTIMTLKIEYQKSVRRLHEEYKLQLMEMSKTSSSYVYELQHQYHHPLNEVFSLLEFLTMVRQECQCLKIPSTEVIGVAKTAIQRHYDTFMTYIDEDSTDVTDVKHDRAAAIEQLNQHLEMARSDLDEIRSDCLQLEVHRATGIELKDVEQFRAKAITAQPLTPLMAIWTLVDRHRRLWFNQLQLESLDESQRFMSRRRRSSFLTLPITAVGA